MNQGNEAENLNSDNYEKSALPQGLNVLTILTFIGCGLLGLLTMCAPLINDFFLKLLDKQLNSGKDLTAEQITKIEKGKAAIDLAQQHLIPLMVVGIIGIVLCLIGALWMRKLKKDGFWLYLAGELAPLVAFAFIMGADGFSGIGGILKIAIPVVFVALYASQRKYLTR
jgi:hypothetical protein